MAAVTDSFRATVFQTPAVDRLEVLSDVLIEVADGEITTVEPAASVDAARLADATVLGDDVVLLPGLVDTHIHAPQWPQLGTGLDLPLDRWLFEHTFPLEARFDDLAFASAVWDDMVPTLLAHGTTTAVYFGPRDLDSTTLLARACSSHGQRAFVGRTAMDHPEGTPDWYRDPSPSEAIAASRSSVDQILDLGSQLVQPIVTPRFIPACTDETLHGLAEVARERGVRVQTHCSEGDWEHGHVLERCGVVDTVALDRFGLLRPSTVLAHGNFMDDDALTLAGERAAGVAHCPLSNSYFANAVFPARRALELGTPVGLGTDIAGGPSASLFHQVAHAVTVSRHLEDGNDPRLAADERGRPDSRIDIVRAFWMATMGGAGLLDTPVGLIEPGRRFDAVAVRFGNADSPLRQHGDIDDDARRFEKLLRLTTPAEIDDVWVDGRRVAGRGQNAPANGSPVD